MTKRKKSLTEASLRSRGPDEHGDLTPDFTSAVHDQVKFKLALHLV
ncbi:MAG: hypothetical protein K9G69_06555 [Candidatus Nanopelagicales bacterium]|nr:hypothetical protein [Candidatus Nanopelagicales bacterium]